MALKTSNTKKVNLADEEDKFNPQVNQNRKKQLKKQKKLKKKGESTKDEAYDFNDFFVGKEEEQEMDSDEDISLADI